MHRSPSNVVGSHFAPQTQQAPAAMVIRMEEGTIFEEKVDNADVAAEAGKVERRAVPLVPRIHLRLSLQHQISAPAASPSSNPTRDDGGIT